MKKIYLPLLLVLSSITTIAQTSVWYGDKEIWTWGRGTENDPYLIESAENLAFLAYAVNKGYSTEGMYFKLTTNIDLNGSEDQPWEPIGLQFFYSEDGCERERPNGLGSANPKFMGQFDGDSHFISNIYVDNTRIGGLFGYVSGTRDEPAEIRNVFLTSGYIKGWESGGIVGDAGYCNIIRCWNGAEIEGGTVGGIAGYGGKIHNCFNKGLLTGNDSSVGGIVGAQAEEIIECYNYGDIICNGASGGGIIGTNSNRSFILLNCYNTGSITGYSGGSTYYGIGGILGAGWGDMVNCYNIGYVESGFPLVQVGHGTMTNCHFLNTCVEEGEGGLSAEEMRSPSFVDTLNFETDVWGFDDTNINDGYPILINNYYPLPYNLVVRSSDESLGHVHIIQQPDWMNRVATVLAEPIGNHPFMGWISDGQVVSTANPYTFVVEGDVELVANFYGTGVGEETEQKVTISPNPAKDMVNIECENMKGITLCALDGRIIRTYESNTNTVTLDLASLSKGVYILRIETREGIFINKKIIKE